MLYTGGGAHLCRLELVNNIDGVLVRLDCAIKVPHLARSPGQYRIMRRGLLARDAVHCAGPGACGPEIGGRAQGQGLGLDNVSETCALVLTA